MVALVFRYKVLQNWSFVEPLSAASISAPEKHKEVKFGFGLPFQHF